MIDVVYGTLMWIQIVQCKNNNAQYLIIDRLVIKYWALCAC